MGQVNGQARTMGNKAKRLGLGLDSGYGYGCGSGAATGTGAGSCLSWHLGCGYMSKAPQGVEANLKRERERWKEWESGKIYPSGALKFYDSIMRVAAIQFQLRFPLAKRRRFHCVREPRLLF